MSNFILDQSGINSLGGFAYQIKVFALYALQLGENMQIEFETIDDISTKSITTAYLDRNEDKFRNIISGINEKKAIQVKRTSVTRNVANQILLNWILLESSNQNVTEYILFTDDSYSNEDIVFDISSEDLYAEVIKTKQTKKSTIGKVKVQYEKDKENFIKVYDEIKNKYKFESQKSIDSLISDNCKTIFKKAGVNPVTYDGRIHELLKHLTYEIMESVGQKRSYSITYQELITYAEDVCNRITDECIYPIYSEFLKLNKIDFSDLKISHSREYLQLLACKMPQKQIERHLQYSGYYQNVRYKYLELNKLGKIKDIEQTTYDNFEDVKFELQAEQRDMPILRLSETKKRTNSYADSEQIKFGSGIYLTREEETEHQISWEDEDNAKH